MAEQKPQKRSAFMAKLYKDDNELDEIKVLLGNQVDSDIDDKPIKPREIKAKSKISDLSKPSLISRIGRLNLTKGSVALFAVLEFHYGKYAVVSHTRNLKGYLNLKNSNVKLTRGQLIVASVTENKMEGSKKLQLSLDPSHLYRTLSADNVTPGMLVQATVESIEEKGYILNLGFKDNSKGFLKFQETKLETGDLIQVIVKSASSKLVKCEFNTKQTVQSTDTISVTEHTLRPGYFVSAKVAKIYDNGLELTFLGGMKGTVFQDHTGRAQVTNFKVGEKVQARVTAHDVQSKVTTLSLLPHILDFQSIQPQCEIGQVFDKVKVERVVYGSSFVVKLNDNLTGFLHKSHLPVQDEEKKKLDDELQAGSIIPQVRVKEINYFDGLPIVSMKQEIVQSAALDFGSLEIGQFVNATIESVNDLRKTVTLRLNDFVRGILRLEHMSDYPIKVIPPKFTQTEKQIKVRVFSIEDRTLLFTKKDSLMKHDVPIFKSINEVKTGDKIIGVVVAANEHGHIVKSFGDVKGLLTFGECKEELKPGSIVKSLVMFNKKGSGLALTMKNKTVIKQEKSSKQLNDLLPDEQELEQLKQTYSSLLKHNQDCQGKVFNFKVVDTKANYYVVKTVAEKKSKFGVMPKAMSSSFGISLPFDDSEFTFSGFVFTIHNSLPVIVHNSFFQLYSDQIPNNQQDLLDGKRIFLGVIDSVDEKNGVCIRFNSFSSQIAIKDLEHSTNLELNYPVGYPVRVAVNKSQRLSLKQTVINKVIGRQQQQEERDALLDQFQELHAMALQNFKIGQQVQSTVQLVKDYGLILKVDENYTGFIINHHLKSKKPQQGQKIDSIMLDIDCDKRMIDLCQRNEQPQINKDKSRAVVELTKECYTIVSMKSNRDKFGVYLLQQSLNQHHVDYEHLTTGDEIDVTVVKNVRGFYLTAPKQQNFSQNLDQTQFTLGQQVLGVVKSVKGHCAFLQLGMNKGVPQFGRLHRVEIGEEFLTLKVEDKITAKVLRVVQDSGKTWIELTKRVEHMSSVGLNEELSSLLSLETIKQNYKIQAMITDVTAESSSLVQIQVSPFVHGQLLFSDLIKAEDLKTKSLQKLISQYKIGSLIQVFYQNGKFTTKLNQEDYKRGDLVPVRLVKSNVAYGVTVQLSERVFGSIEMCELSDEITSNLVGQFKQRNIFLARVIDTDKNGRFMLSSRQSVVDNWETICNGSSSAFQQFDRKNQLQGNLRNKILKYGAKLAVSQGDLFIGYVTNVSKAGCFVCIGHQTTVRIGLNELDDSDVFDFQTQMLVGRQVVGRITKVIDEGSRFNASLRRSLVVYGVHQVNKNSLKTGDLLTAFVLAIAKDSVFGQIKGSYLKLTIKNTPQNVQAGQLLEVRLLKVKQDEIKAEYIQMSNKKLDQNEETARSVYESVQQESQQDLQNLNQQKEEIDVEAMVNKRRELNATEVQIRDLQTLAELEQDNDEEQDEEQDSDDEEMKRITAQLQEDSQEEEGEDEIMEESSENQQDESMEEGEQSMDEIMEDQGEQKLKGRKALRAQIDQEKEIRAKEAQMRQTSGAEPKSVNDFERLIVADQDQSFVWIKYMAFVLDNLDADAARRIAERAVKCVGITAESDKLNLWIAYMNLENKFGTQESLQKITNRALEVNDRLKVYLQLISIYRSSDKLEYVEDLYKKLCKKYNESLDVWSQYIEFLFEAPEGFTDPKIILQRSLQALPKQLHVNIISKFGMLEYKAGRNESGRTMFEGIVTNYPKRMDIWAVYMDMEVKYGQDNQVQSRHLFERCLSLPEIQKKPKKMKLVFRKYMEFEHSLGNKQKVDALRQRVEQYLENLFESESD